MTPIIFTNYIDEGLIWFDMISGGFVGVIFKNTEGQILCQKETGKVLFRFPGGGIDERDGSLFGLKSWKNLLALAKKTAIRESEEEAGIIITDVSRLRLVGISKGENEQDEKGGQVHVRIFFSYEFLPGEKIPNGFQEVIEDKYLKKYEYFWVPIKDGKADLLGSLVKLSRLHFIALVRYLRASH